MKNLVCALLIGCPGLAFSQSAVNASLPLRHFKLNSGYGYRIHPLTGQIAFHAGIDLAAQSDTVLAIMAGVVRRVGYDPGLGLFVLLDHATGLQSTYGHLSQSWVLAGDTVEAGYPIGLTGATGRVTGEHLHFAVKYGNRFFNPLAFLRALLMRRASFYEPQNANHEYHCRNFTDAQTP